MKSNDVEAKVDSQEIIIDYIVIDIRMKGEFLYSKFKVR